MEKKNKLHIGFDAKRLFNNKRGLATYARTLLLALRRSFPDIHIYLYTPKVNSPYKLAEFKDDPGFIIRTYNGPFSWYWRSNGIIKQLESDHIELYHGLSSELPRGIHKTKIKSVVTVHDLLWKEHSKDYSIADRIILDNKLKSSIKRADKVVVISDQTLQLLTEHTKVNPQKLKSIEQIAGPEFYQHYHESAAVLNNDFILAFSDKKGRKNLDLLTAAMAYLDNQDIKLVLVGGPKNKFDGHHQIISVPHLSYKELISYYHQSLLCAYPSSNEGFGLPILESLMCQTPVCVMDKAPMNQFNHPLVHTFHPSIDAKGLGQLFSRIIGQSNPIAEFNPKTSEHSYARQHMDLYLSVLGY